MDLLYIKILCVIFVCACSHLAFSEEQKNAPQTADKAEIVSSTKSSIEGKDTSERATIKSTTTIKAIEHKLQPKLVCPDKKDSRPLFALRCKVSKECNKNQLCCDNRCLKAVPAPDPEPIHAPALFGLVERVCPSDRLPELLDIRECIFDSECSPRICCRETLPDGEVRGYCRTPEPKFDRLPAARQLLEPLKLMMSYMQCTPPPPPVLDVFPLPCHNPLDCFPNLCCQERGKRYCRPPKRSLLALIATVGQRIIPSNIARDFLNRVAP